MDNPNVAIGLESVEPGVLKLHFEGQLDAPENATHICFSLTIGLTYYGPILDGAASGERRLDDLRERHARPGATGLIDSPSQPSTMRKAAKWHSDTHPRRSIDGCRTDTEVVVQHVNVFDSSPHDEPFRDIPGPLPGTLTHASPAFRGTTSPPALSHPHDSTRPAITGTDSARAYRPACVTGSDRSSSGAGKNLHAGIVMKILALLAACLLAGCAAQRPAAR